MYQALLSGIINHNELGDRIVEAIKLAQAFRQVEKVVELSQILVNNPIKEFQVIGQYYLVWSKYRGRENQPQMLERIIEQSKTYKAKALTFRGALSFYQGKLDESLFFYTESLKSRPTVSEYLLSVKEIAVIKSIEGFKESALKDLETLLPLFKYAEPLAAFDVLNSYAVELGEAGRKYEARSVINHVLASPLADAYPECHATAQELMEPNRAFISLPQSLPRFEHKQVEVETKKGHQISKPKKPAKVLSFPKLKEAPLLSRPVDIYQKELDQMTESEKKDLLLSLIQSESISNRGYNKLLVAAGMVKPDASAKEIELDNLATIDDIISEWCNLIEPEDFAAVMSALRDCDDSTRRNNIIDAMISVAFKQTSAAIDSEEEWRLKFERRLPKE